jgi:hypothetical protein
MLAVSDEEGNVNFIDPSRNANEDRSAWTVPTLSRVLIASQCTDVSR